LVSKAGRRSLFVHFYQAVFASEEEEGQTLFVINNSGIGRLPVKATAYLRWSPKTNRKKNKNMHVNWGLV